MNPSVEQPKVLQEQPLQSLPVTKKSALAKFLASFHFAGQGIWYAFSTQRNMRIHGVIALIAITLGILLRISAAEFAVIFLTIAVVFVAEMVNTAIELCVDLVSPTYHALAKHAKDVGAGSVLIAAILSLCIGMNIFLPRIWDLLFR